MVPSDPPPSGTPRDQSLEVVALSSSALVFNIADVKDNLIGILSSFIDKVEGSQLYDLVIFRSTMVESRLTNACFEVNLSKKLYLIDLIFFFHI